MAKPIAADATLTAATILELYDWDGPTQYADLAGYDAWLVEVQLEGHGTHFKACGQSCRNHHYIHGGPSAPNALEFAHRVSEVFAPRLVRLIGKARIRAEFQGGKQVVDQPSLRHYYSNIDSRSETAWRKGESLPADEY